MQNRFSNPATGTHYDWHTNHDPQGEEMAGKARNIARSPNTSGSGVVLQQGDDGSYVIKLSGHIDMRIQHQTFWAYYALSKNQTFYFRDFDNQEYEVMMTSYQEKRVGKLGPSGRDPAPRITPGSTRWR
jgi:hypothetical protein